MADQLTIKNTSIPLGWEPSPFTEQANKQAEDLHARASAPIVETVMKAASPDATPEDRVKAGDIFKNSNEARMGDVIQSIVNLNPRDLYIALTGGASKPEIGFDAAGNQFEVMYNQRGERRSIRDLRTNKLLDDKSLAETNGITTRLDVTPERQKAFQAIGATVQDVAKARSDEFVKTQKAAGAAGATGKTIQDLAVQNDAITKRLSPASLDAQTLGFIRGISTIRTGDTQATRSLIDKAKEVANGTKKYNDLTNDEKKSLGLNLGLQYHEGKGFRNANGDSVNTNDIDKIGRSFEESQSSDKAIQTRQQDMLARAQTLFAGKVERLDDITALINNNAKIAAAQNSIEQHGGIGVASPNLPHELGNSFMSARQKAISDEFYGISAQLFSQFVAQKRAQMRPGQSPDIGALQVEFANSPEMERLRRSSADRSHQVEKENAIVAEEINKRSAMRGLTNEANRTPVQPPAEAMPNRTTPAGSRAPAQQTAPQTTSRRSLGDIFGGPR
jgi:hypothetical protein